MQRTKIIDLRPNQSKLDQKGPIGPNRNNVDKIEPKWIEWTEYNQCGQIGLKWI